MAVQFRFHFALAFLSILSLANAYSRSFSVDLIHRDSSKSPFYNPSETPSQRLSNALRRSIGRVNRFNLAGSVSPSEAQSEIISNSGEYLMKISIGTPPFPILAIADTGSDLIWTQCEPCTECYKQVDPLFDPQNSSTYKDIPCHSNVCQSLSGTSCSGGTTFDCQYSVSYGDRSYTHGNLALDTVTIGSTTGHPVVFPKTIVGCGHNNAGTFDEKGSGIIGLGAGQESLITQMGSKQFSYCLVPIFSQSENTSKINFGSDAVVKGADVVTTPLVSKHSNTFYYLTLEGFSVGNERVDIRKNAEEGNIVIDSGTTLTVLQDEDYSRLESAVKRAITLEPVENPGQVLSLCYESTAEFQVPIITAHFSGGADVKLEALNTFVRVSERLVCFAFRSSGTTMAIYGNLAQMNYLVGYDAEAKTLSFQPADCSKH